ncbi:MEKHLA domain-containing protein [Pararhizobium sp.]|uniref:MEKHLA domain-containing protein n=1 Tax=Pararhizobium sp. TaxID=1977563 RepID=UPI003D10971C
MTHDETDTIPALATDRDFFHLLASSYSRIVGESLTAPGYGPGWLYAEAPFVVVAHNADDDPRFVYANRTAQSVFEYPWDEFTTLPSRLSAEAPERSERQRLLAAVAASGFIANYRGLRVRKSGTRFWMEDGLVWQLVDKHGMYRGQAARFSRWTEDV